MDEFPSCKTYFLVNMCHKSLCIDVHNGFKCLIIKAFLHLGHVAHAFFGETLELCYVDIISSCLISDAARPLSMLSKSVIVVESII